MTSVRVCIVGNSGTVGVELGLRDNVGIGVGEFVGIGVVVGVGVGVAS